MCRIGQRRSCFGVSRLLLQMLGGLGQGGPSLGSGQRGNIAGSSMARRNAGGDELAALAELPSDQAALWRQRIL